MGQCSSISLIDKKVSQSLRGLADTVIQGGNGLKIDKIVLRENI